MFVQTNKPTLLREVDISITRDILIVLTPEVIDLTAPELP